MADKLSLSHFLTTLDEIIRGRILKDRIKEYQSPSNEISCIWPIQKKLVLVGFIDGSISILRNDLQEVRHFLTQIGKITRFIRIQKEVYAFGELSTCVKLTSDFTQILECPLPFPISLSDYSSTSGLVVYFNRETCKILLKKCQSDTNPFESLEEIQMASQINLLKLNGSYLFLTTDTSLEKWNLTTKTREVFIEVSNITALSCSTSSCFFVANGVLKALEINSEHNIHSENVEEMSNTVELKQGVFNIALAQKKFLYILSNDLMIIEVVGKEFRTICNLPFDCPHGQLIADSIYLYAYSPTQIKRIQSQEDLKLDHLISMQTNIIDYAQKYDETLFVCTSDNTIWKFEIDIGQLIYTETQSIVYYEDTITCLAINLIKDELAVGSQESTIKIYTTTNLALLRILNCHKFPIVKVCYLNSFLVSIGNYLDEIEIFFEENKKLEQIRTSLKNSSKKIFCTNNLSSLYILQFNSIVRFNSVGLREEKIIQETSHAQYFKCDSKYLVIIDRFIEIREVETLEIICNVGYEKLLAGENIQAVGISSSYLLVSTFSTIFFLSIENKVFIGCVRMNIKVLEITFFKDYIYFNADKNISKCRNFLLERAEKLIIGPVMPSLAFLSYVDLDFRKRQVPDHIFTWTILPLCINIVHFLAHTSSVSLLKTSFKKQANFLKSFNNISPLTISLQKGFKETSEYLVKKIARESRTRPFILSIIESDLPSINNSSVMNISSLYKEALTKSEQSNLPTYIVPKDLQWLTLSKGYIINPEDFIADSQESNRDEAFVTFFNSNLRLQVEKGSKGSIAFLSSLLNCQDSEVFSSRIIREYLSFKWNDTSYHLKIQTGLYLLFLIIITIEDKIADSTWRIIMLIILCIINTANLLVEYLQIRFSYKRYLRSKTNWMDLMRIFMTYLYVATLIFQDDSEENLKYQVSFSTIVLFVSYLKGMMHFKLLKETRYMIKMIDEIVKDSFFFTLILIYVIAAFTTFYNFARSGSNYIDSFKIVYLIMFGEFYFDKDSYVEWLCFYFISIGLPLVMFNLLVAIMGGTYKRVYDGMVENDFKALTQLILEMETVHSAMFDNEDNLMYLHKCVVGSEKDFDFTNNLNAKIKNCIIGINQLRENCAKVEKGNLKESFVKYKNNKMERLAELKGNVEKMKKQLVDKIAT